MNDISVASVPNKSHKVLITAPEIAYQNTDYPLEAFEILYKLEDRHFWFVNRNDLIVSLIKKYTNTKPGDKYLELGCGTGFVLKRLMEEFKFDCTGTDIYASSLQFSQQRVPEAHYIQQDATKMRFFEEFDVVGAFDVLEHISEDKTVIHQINRSLKSGGYLIISVPQHMFMWSKTDETAYHKRRYSRNELVNKLQMEGFQPIFLTSYVFLLFPFMIISRFYSQMVGSISRKYQGNTCNNESKFELIQKEMSIHPVINTLFNFFCKIELLLIDKKIHLPFGGSLLCVAEKISKS